MGVTATVFEQESLVEARALAVVGRHGGGRRCRQDCPGTPRCPHLAWAWRWILGEVG